MMVAGKIFCLVALVVQGLVVATVFLKSQKFKLLVLDSNDEVVATYGNYGGSHTSSDDSKDRTKVTQQLSSSSSQPRLRLNTVQQIQNRASTMKLQSYQRSISRQKEIEKEQEIANTKQRLELDGPLMMDLMVPTYNRNERLQKFAAQLGTAISQYHQKTAELQAAGDTNVPRIAIFRLLVTCFTPEEKAGAEEFQKRLAELAGLPLDNVVMVHGEAAFSRSLALHLLHKAACHEMRCLASRLDVDMEVRAIFFDHAVETVILEQRPPEEPMNLNFQKLSEAGGPRNLTNSTPAVYFPIVWSAYNPATVKLVEKHFIRQGKAIPPEFSTHRGHWRYYGKGMYVIRGPDAARIDYRDLVLKHQGWGQEDVDFMEKVIRLPRRIFRRTERGLIHTWHEKSCVMGVDVHDELKQRQCFTSVNNEEGSPLGKQLVAAKKERQAAKATNSIVQPPPPQPPSSKANNNNVQPGSSTYSMPRVLDDQIPLPQAKKNRMGQTMKKPPMPQQHPLAAGATATAPKAETLF